MRSNSRQARNSSPVMFETLEARELMSATTVHVATPAVHLVTTETHAEIVAEAAAVKAAAAAAKVVKVVTPSVTAPITSFHQTVAKSQYLNLVGTWTGTIGYDGATTMTPFSINFQFQREGSASGTFNLGPAIGNQSAQSTMIISNHNNVRALILNSTLWVGFTGVIEAGSNTIIGRFAYDSPAGWRAGSYTVTRN